MRTGLTTELDRQSFPNNQRKVSTDLGESGPGTLSMTLYVIPGICLEIAERRFLPRNSGFIELLNETRFILITRKSSV